MRLAELAARLGATLDGDGQVEITGLAPIEAATAGELSFFFHPRYRRYVQTTGASALIVGEDFDGPFAGALLRAPNPYVAFVAAAGLFDTRPSPPAGIHETAVVGAGTRIGEGASVGAYAVVGPNCTIGDGATLHPHVVIYEGCRIGDRFTAHAGAVVRENVTIGDDVVLQPGAAVGADGFGFLPRPAPELPLPIAQIGSVELGDAVEVGANSTVDRAAVGVTRLAAGVKLDDLVMVAHGCQIGESSMLAGQAGMAGSTRLGARVMVGGQAGFAGHLEVGEKTEIAARAGVVADVPAGSRVAGMPAVDIALWRRCVAALERLPKLLARVRALERKRAADDD